MTTQHPPTQTHRAKRPRLIAPSTLTENANENATVNANENANDTFTDDFFTDLLTPSSLPTPICGSPFPICGSPLPICGSPFLLLSPNDINHLLDGLEDTCDELPDIPIYKRNDRVHLTTQPKKKPFWVQKQRDAFHYNVSTTKRGTTTFLADVAEMVPVQLGV